MGSLTDTAVWPSSVSKQRRHLWRPQWLRWRPVAGHQGLGCLASSTPVALLGRPLAWQHVEWPGQDRYVVLQTPTT